VFHCSSPLEILVWILKLRAKIEVRHVIKDEKCKRLKDKKTSLLMLLPL